MCKHPGILEVAIVEVPDDYWGELPKAFVALKENYRGKLQKKTSSTGVGKIWLPINVRANWRFENLFPNPVWAKFSKES